MRHCERKFNINNNNSNNTGVVGWFESDCGGRVEGAFRRPGCQDVFCEFAGRQAIRSAVQFEDALKDCLEALCDQGISPQQFACILDKLAEVERYLIEKIELGKEMAGC